MTEVDARTGAPTSVDAGAGSGGGEGYEQLGTRRLSLPDVVAQSVGFLGPVFSAAFLIPLVAGIISASGKGGGVASPISVIIASVGVFALGWIVSRYARRIHAAGSLYDYVADGLGRRAGVVAGWLYYGGILALVGGLVLLTGGYLQSTIATSWKVTPLPNWAWSLLVVGMLFCVAYFVRISTRLQLTLALVSLSVLVSFFIYVIVDLGSANSGKPFEPSSSTFGGFALVVVYLLMAVGALRTLRADPAPVRLCIAAVVGLAIAGGAIYGSFYKVSTPTILAPELAVAWLAIGIVVAAVTKGRRAASDAMEGLRAGEERTTGSLAGAARTADTG